MKPLYFAALISLVAVTACEQRQDAPEQGTRPVGGAGGADQIYGTNPVNDPAGNIRQAPETGTNQPTAPNQ